MVRLLSEMCVVELKAHSLGGGTVACQHLRQLGFLVTFIVVDTGVLVEMCASAYCACMIADVDDITVITDARDYHNDSSPAGVRDVITSVIVHREADSSDSVTDHTVAGVSTQFRRCSDDSQSAVWPTGSSAEPLSLPLVERSSTDDRADSPHQQTDSNRAAIDLLLWKLIELERRITLGQVTDVGLLQ